MLKHLMPLINNTPHELYCEPFCGGAAVLLARTPGKREIINDIDGDLINLYRQAKYHRQEVIRAMRLLPESRELFYEQQSMISNKFSTEIQRAAAWAYVNFYCFGAVNKTFGPKRVGFYTRSSLDRKLIAFSKRLDRVTIEHTSWEHCIKLYDCKPALFFCDPPYTGCAKIGAYDGWSIDDVKKMRDILYGIKGKFIVTLNDCPDNRSIFKGCTFHAISTASSMRKPSKPGERFNEMIIVKK